MIKLIDRDGKNWWINPKQVCSISRMGALTTIMMGDHMIYFDESPETLVHNIEIQQLPKYKQDSAKSSRQLREDLQREKEEWWKIQSARELKT